MVGLFIITLFLIFVLVAAVYHSKRPSVNSAFLLHNLSLFTIIISIIVVFWNHI